MVQLTTKANYEGYGKAVGENFTSSDANKLKLERYPHAQWSGAWFWMHNNLGILAEKNDLIRITMILNGGLNGFPKRKSSLVALIQKLCSEVSTTFSFSTSASYHLRRDAFAWGLWNDPGDVMVSKYCHAWKASGRNKSAALEGYKRFKLLSGTSGFYGYSSDRIIDFVDDRIEELSED